MALIDRDELIAKIRDDGILGNGYSDSEREDDVIDMIESCQTVDAKPVDAVEIVRCKDCKHYEDEGAGWCGINSHFNDVGGWNAFDYMGYCSFGERSD